LEKRWNSNDVKPGVHVGCGRIPLPKNFKRFTGLFLMFLQRSEEHGEAFLSIIITGNATLVFQYAPEIKVVTMTSKHHQI
jgi:hypothetical protein